MDTAHLFHLPFEEMTITPLDFAAATTRLRFFGEPVPMSNEAYKVRSGHDVGHVNSEQLARYFLFSLLSIVIFRNTSSIG